MSIWNELDIEPTDDLRTIKRAYAIRLKKVHPEDDPDGFQRLRQAYEQARRWAEYEQQSASRPAEGTVASPEPAETGEPALSAEQEEREQCWQALNQALESVADSIAGQDGERTRSILACMADAPFMQMLDTRSCFEEELLDLLLEIDDPGRFVPMSLISELNWQYDKHHLDYTQAELAGAIVQANGCWYEFDQFTQKVERLLDAGNEEVFYRTLKKFQTSDFLRNETLGKHAELYLLELFDRRKLSPELMPPGLVAIFKWEYNTADLEPRLARVARYITTVTSMQQSNSRWAWVSGAYDAEELARALLIDTHSGWKHRFAQLFYLGVNKRVLTMLATFREEQPEILPHLSQESIRWWESNGLNLTSGLKYAMNILQSPYPLFALLLYLEWRYYDWEDGKWILLAIAIASIASLLPKRDS
jgi:hypothetical protein